MPWVTAAECLVRELPETVLPLKYGAGVATANRS
jgi:hypothetical protein